MQIRKQQLELDMEQQTGYGTTDWFQIGKGVRQGYILSPCLFNFYAEYIVRNTGCAIALFNSQLLFTHPNSSDLGETVAMIQGYHNQLWTLIECKKFNSS